MYNEREALAYSGKLPAQQASITPQLLDLLAMQKVEADKKAAAQQLAMASGQPQPTIAQGLQQRAMQSARQEIAQKMGLGDLAQAKPPAGPMPQGLANVPTNLPTEYRGGGIIAFATGGSGGDAHGRYRQDDQTDDQTDDQLVDQISSSGGDAHGRYRKDAVDTNQDANKLPASFGEQPPQMSPEDQKFIRDTQAAQLKLRDQDPEALAREAMEFQQQKLSPAREAGIAQKREQQAGLKALYQRQIAERPSDFQVALDRMAQNIHQPGGFGAAMVGVSPAVQAAHQGYTTQEINQLNTLSGIDDEINKAIQSNDVDAYNAYVTKRKEVEAQIKTGVETSTTMADVLQKVQAGKENNYRTTSERYMAAAKLADERAAAALLRNDTLRYQIETVNATKLVGLAQAAATAQAARETRLGGQEAARENRNHTTALSLASAAANKAMADPLTVTKLPPGTTADDLTLQYYGKFYNALNGKGELPVASTPTTRLKFDAQGNQIK
jgi:hypothetical protein